MGRWRWWRTKEGLSADGAPGGGVGFVLCWSYIVFIMCEVFEVFGPVEYVEYFRLTWREHWPPGVAGDRRDHDQYV